MSLNLSSNHERITLIPRVTRAVPRPHLEGHRLAISHATFLAILLTVLGIQTTENKAPHPP